MYAILIKESKESKVEYDEDGFLIEPPESEYEHNYDLSREMASGLNLNQSMFACDVDDMSTKDPLEIAPLGTIENEKKTLLKRHRIYEKVRSESEPRPQAIRFARRRLQKSLDRVHSLDPKIPVDDIETSVSIIKSEIESEADSLHERLKGLAM